MNFNKILIGLIVLVIVGAGIFYFQSRKVTAPTTSSDKTVTPTPAPTPAPAQTPTPAPTPAATPTASAPTAAQIAAVPAKAVATVDTSMGSFQVTLDGKSAPQTVANFINLAKSGFYNNLTFHRIVVGFVIQGGDPSGDGTGGPGYTIPAEIKLKHTRGAIGMASTAAKGPSSGSQFFIDLQDLPSLDGNYTAFGYVTSGMDVVDKIGAVATSANPQTGEKSVPLEKVIINKITIK